MPYKFSFRYKENETSKKHTCFLSAQKCGALLKNGRPCQRKVTIGTPLCHSHLLELKNLKIQKSTIPNAGKGLFAKLPKGQEQENGGVVFNKDDTIIDYVGDLQSVDDTEEYYGEYTAPYAVGLTTKFDLDSACKRGVGSLANSKERGPGKKPNNATISTHRGNKTAKLVATRRIKNNDEILLAYGREYKFNEPVKHSTYFANKAALIHHNTEKTKKTKKTKKRRKRTQRKTVRR